MAWPVDTFYASAPGYSFSGSLPWNSGGSQIFSNFMAACGAYESAARSEMQGLLSQGWLPTGQTSSGTAAPALPADHMIPFTGNCGSGQRSTRALIGNGGFTQVEVQFYSKKYKKEYRWVEDSPYIPAGVYAWTSDPQITELQPYDSVLASFRDGLAAISGYTDSNALQSAVNTYLIARYGESFEQFFPSNGLTRTLEFFEYFIQNLEVYGRWRDIAQPNIIDTLALGYYLPQPEVLGQWHLEMRIIADGGNGEVCNTAQYAQMSRQEEDNRRPEPPNKPRTFPPNPWSFPPGGGGGGAWPPNSGPNGGDNKIHINNTCAGKWITSADIWDTNLQALLTSGDIILSPGYTLDGAYHPAVEWSFTTPGGPVVIQTGTPLQGYNLLQGSLVYDMDLEKWGKWKQEYSILVEFTGSNISNISNFSYTDLGMTAGLLHSDGLIYLFDHQPADSWIRYGKIGYYRLGMVHFLESRIDFRTYASGSLTVDFSMDGRNLDSSLQRVYNYNSQLMYRVYLNQRARWMTLKISGNYDLQYMEIRGNISCRR